MSNRADMQAVVAALQKNDRFVVTSHEAPDGDALGSLLAIGLALRELEKDVVMFLGGPAPLPGEYRFLELNQRGLQRERPADFGERVLVAVDCASAGRVGAEPGVVDAARFTVNIDHHHDNPRFGDVNLIVPDASSTGEVLADVIRELGVAITPDIADRIGQDIVLVVQALGGLIGTLMALFGRARATALLQTRITRTGM